MNAKEASPEQGQVTFETVREAYLSEFCDDALFDLAVRLLKERDEARLEARAATEVAIQKLRFGMYQNQELSDKETLGLWKAIEAEKQKIIDEWNSEVSVFARLTLAAYRGEK